MKLSLNWLKEFIDLPKNESEIADVMSQLGFPVDQITRTGIQVPMVVAARIDRIEPHPNADRLQLAFVHDGKREHQVVCGAPNIQVGQVVPLALPGAILAPDFQIKPTKIRGIESHGMLCSEKELGLSGEQSGIFILPEKSPLGREIREIMGKEDIIFDVDVTPNRPDVLSHMGMARELAAYYNKKLKIPRSRWKKSSQGPSLKLSNKEPILCPRYLGKIFSNVKVGPSPDWMVQRLNTCGIRSINNIVDITNYVLLEWGHPLHAFDWEKISGGEIVIRRARPQEKLLALDEKEYELNSTDLVIADSKNPLAIAGIMGGQISGVTSTTTQILLESAVFQPVIVRNTSKKINLKSESSYRFERGTDFHTAEGASLRASQLIVELAQGQPGQAQDSFPGKKQRHQIPLRKSKLNMLIGLDIPAVKTEKILKNLEFRTVKFKEGWKCQVPPHRKDISVESDLIEEVTRFVGYNTIPETVPPFSTGKIPSNQVPLENNDLIQILKGMGINETISSSLTVKERALHLGWEETDLLEIQNPLSKEETILRPALLSNLITAVQKNIFYQRDSVRLFEIGHRYFKEKNSGAMKEPVTISLILYGNVNPLSWRHKDSPVDFYHLKGILETINLRSGEKIEFKSLTSSPAFLHPLQSLELNRNGQPVGWMGLLHPEMAEKYDFKLPCVVAEWDLEPEKLAYSRLKPLSKFPAVERDMALVVDKKLSWGEIEKSIRSAGTSILEFVAPFDIYSGGNINPTKKSVACRLRLRHPDKTLSEGDISSVMEKIKEILKTRCGAELR